jgi:hypothetical protein
MNGGGVGDRVRNIHADTSPPHTHSLSGSSLVAVVQLLVDVVQMDATLNLSHLIRQLVQQVLMIKRRAASPAQC